MTTATMPREPLKIRPLADPDWPAASDLIEMVFHEVPVLPEARAAERALLELDRSLAAFDGNMLAGMTAAYTMRMTVPGGVAVPMAGVTWVAVRPTHRRRGILSTLMRRQLADVHEAGREAVAALYASEPPIYGRFGYGLASQVLDLTIDRGGHALQPGAPADVGLRLRQVPPEDSLSLVEPVYAAAVATRPGMLARDKAWAQRQVFDPEELRRGATPLRCVLAEDAGGVRGYAWYSAVGDWDESSLPTGKIRVREAYALDPAAYAAVWRYLLDVDLTTLVQTRIPMDDPLLHLLANPRTARPKVKDGLFVRLVDVGRALAERRYAAPVDTVVEVTDEVCPWNAGRWRLSGGPDGAACDRTGAAADLAMSVRELGAVYLGGGSLRALAGAGRVAELRAGALAAVSRAFLSDLQPYGPYSF